MCGHGSQRGILTGNVPLCPQLSPSWRPLPCCGFGAWKLMGPTLTLTLPGTGTLPRNLILPRSLILLLSGLLARALTSALARDHENGVASALETSLARIEHEWLWCNTRDN